jgi:hypothetical protein
MSIFTRPMDLPQRRAALLGTVQLVILAVLIGAVPPVGLAVALVWVVLRFNVKHAESKKVDELEREYYPWKFEPGYTPNDQER